MSVAAALTLLPALLGVVGTRIEAMPIFSLEAAGRKPVLVWARDRG